MTRARPVSGDRGVVLIFFAISLTAVCVLAAVALGGSTGYSAVRTAQNSADAAALAATARLRQVGTGDAAPSEVATVAASVAEANGAAAGTTECEVVTGGYAITRAPADVLGPCDGTTETHVLAAGVRVTVQNQRSVPFGAFVTPNEEVVAVATSTATIQPVRAGSSPFMLCATAVGHPVPPILAAPTYDVNPLAVGQSFMLWGTQMKNDGRDCGNGSSSWRGLVDFEETFPVPSPDPVDDTEWWEIETGNKSGHIPSLLVGTDVCGGENLSVTDLTVGCRLAVPVCTHGNGSTGADFKLHCVRFLAFEITYIGKVSAGVAPCHATETNSVICADLVGGAVADDGATGSSTPSPDEVVAIRVVE